MAAGDGARRTGARRAGARRRARAGLRAAGRFFAGREGFFLRVTDFFDRFDARAFALDRAGRGDFRFFAIHSSRLMETGAYLSAKTC